MNKIKVLFVGESWTVTTTHIKGVDFFSQSTYDEGAKWLKEALESGNMEVEHMQSHKALTDFPNNTEALQKYDCVILSDIGSNTLLLHPETTKNSKRTPNRLDVIKNYVKSGGALIMIGGYMSFQGIEGKANYHNTAIEEILPVEIASADDRVEVPEGICPHCLNPNHKTMAGLPMEFPFLLFYNRVTPKADAEVILSFGNDPLLVVWECGKGRSAAFTADVAPHGAPPEFLNWEYFNRLWINIVEYICTKK